MKYRQTGWTRVPVFEPEKKGLPWWVWAIGLLMLLGWANGGKAGPKHRATPVPTSYEAVP